MTIKIAKQPYTEIELIVDECQHEFGISPCTASGEPCHKTRVSCKDSANYLKQDKSYIFCSSVSNFPKAQNIIPCVERVDDTPASITGGLGLGSRAKITAKLRDLKHHDRGVDPYFDQRSYDTSRGTFFGKWLARNPYYQGRTAKVRYGDLPVPYDRSKLTELHLIIENISHPSGDDVVTMTFKDILKKVDSKRAKYPLQSIGELAVACGTGDLTVTLKAGQAINYVVDEHVSLGDEIMLVTAIDTGSDVLTVTRAQWGTSLSSHSIDAKVQLCKSYSNTNIVDILKDLSTNGAGIDIANIPEAEWEAEKTDWVPDYNLTALIPKPEPVDKLMNELMILGLLDIWPDLEANEIKLKASSPFRQTQQVISEQDIVESSLKISDKPELRLSRVWVRFAAENPLKKLDDDTNFKRGYALGDIEKESPEQYNEIRADVISSRWLRDSAQDRDHAFALTNRLLSRYKDNPKEFEFELWMDRANLPKTGDVIKIQFSRYQDLTGAPVLKPCQILETSIKRSEGKVKYRALAYDSAINGGDGDNTVTISENQFNYNLWLAVGSPPEPITVDVYLDPNVSICSLDAGSPSFAVGNFAEGSVINIHIDDGKIKGAGGHGGDGGGKLTRVDYVAGEPDSETEIFNLPAEQGQLGGHAILGQKGVTINLYLGVGLIAPGYNGQGGIYSEQMYTCYDNVCDPIPPVNGHAGDGGDGCLPGEGGNGFQFGNDGLDGADNEADYRDVSIAGAAVYNPEGIVNVIASGTILGDIIQQEIVNPVGTNEWSVASYGTASVLLSNSNRTAEANNQDAFVRTLLIESAYPRSSGKTYSEVLIQADPAHTISMGLRLDGSSSTFGLFEHRPNGEILYSGTSFGIFPDAAYTTGDVVGYAFDLDAEEIWVSVNGIWAQGDPSTGSNSLFSFFTGSAVLWISLSNIPASSVVPIATFNEPVYSIPIGYEYWVDAN